MKVLSLEEINEWETSLLDEGLSAVRLLHTAREYHRLKEALRKAILWGECVSNRIDKERDQINWAYLNEAREALKDTQ